MESQVMQASRANGAICYLRDGEPVLEAVEAGFGSQGAFFYGLYNIWWAAFHCKLRLISPQIGQNLGRVMS